MTKKKQHQQAVRSTIPNSIGIIAVLLAIHLLINHRMASSSSSNQNGPILEDEQIFRDILASMGTTNFDPMVAVALNEYARSNF